MIYLALCGAPWLDHFSAGCVPVADHHIMEWMGAIVQDDKVTRKASFSAGTGGILQIYQAQMFSGEVMLSKFYSP